jgi:hypothetical protein
VAIRLVLVKEKVSGSEICHFWEEEGRGRKRESEGVGKREIKSERIKALPHKIHPSSLNGGVSE